MATPSWAAKTLTCASSPTSLTSSKKRQGIDLRQDKLALQRLKERLKKRRKSCRPLPQTEVNLPFITADASGPKHLNMKLSRAKLEALSKT
jgi:molecular chaperone DnaK